MSEQLLKDLAVYSEVKASLESCQVIPTDAQKILGIFMGERSEVSVEADRESATIDGDKNSTLGKISSRIKETLKNLIEWVMERFRDFKEWARTYLIGVEQAEKEIEAAKGLLSEHRNFKTEKITLLPTVTGALAVQGSLDENFPNKFVNLRGVLEMMVNVRDGLSDLAENAMAVAEKWINAEDHFTGQESKEAAAVIQSYAKVAEPISRVLTQPNESKTFSGPNRAHNEAIFGGRNFEKVQDVASLPLPGGYAVTSILVKKINGQGFMGMDDSFVNAVDTLIKMLDGLSPNLVKVYQSGITFSGAPLNAAKAKIIIDEGVNLLNIVKNSRESSGSYDKVEKQFKAIIQTLEDKKSQTSINISRLGSLMRSSVKLIEGDRFKTYRYVVKTVRASLRYISASVESTAPEAVPSSMRLNAPA